MNGMKNKPAITALIALLAVLVFGMLIVEYRKEPTSPSGNGAAKLITYRNVQYGFEFKYPESYAIDEKEVGNGERNHYNITLIDRTELEGLKNAPPREGPIAITIDIYQNDIDKQPVLFWVTGTNISNFKLSDGTYETATVAGKEAIIHQWSGLYEADNVILEHKENIFSLASTWLGAEDQIREDFAEMIKSLVFF